jgi:hypothetical protein
VTAFVYKNHRVVKTDSNDHPVFLGPVLLHKEASFEVYHYFLSQAMEIGSDDEKALAKSIQMCFPEAKRSLCTKHLKENVSEYLKNKISVNNSERHNVVEKIFGSAGVLDANDTFEFEERSDFLLSDLNMYPSFRQYYDRTLKPKLLLNIQNLAKTDRGWTNNNAESMNNILKIDTNWTPQSTPDLINKISDVIKLHLIDLRRALYGTGNYRLCSQYKKLYIKEAVFRAKSKENRDNYLYKFLRCKKQSNNEVKSATRNYSIPNKAKCVAKKPQQTKRLRNTKTSKKFAKKNPLSN